MIEDEDLNTHAIPFFGLLTVSPDVIDLDAGIHNQQIERNYANEPSISSAICTQKISSRKRLDKRRFFTGRRIVCTINLGRDYS